MCPRCRAFKTGLQDESITCTVCGKVFILPRELRLFSRMFNWPRPRRCIGGCRKQAPPLTETEQEMADFLRRLRSARRSSGIGRASLHPSYGVSSGRRQGKGPLESRGTPLNPEIGGSLAEALKEFQAKKRRRS